MHKENTVASQRQNGDVYTWYGRESFSMGRSDQKIQAGQELGDMSRKRNISGLFFYRQNNALVRESVRDDVHIYIYIYFHSFITEG